MAARLVFAVASCWWTMPSEAVRFSPHHWAIFGGGTVSREILRGPGLMATPFSMSRPRIVQLSDLDVLDKGTFSTVFRATDKEDPSRRVVVKRVHLGSDEEIMQAKREIAMLSDLEGAPGVVQYHGAYSTDDMQPGSDVYIILEEALGDMQELVIGRSMDEVDLSTRLRLFADVLRAVRELGEEGIVHRDLKPENILIVGHDSGGLRGCSAVLCDFGCASKGLDTQWSPGLGAGTARYLPPEAWLFGYASPAQDVWALGVVLFQLLSGELPSPVGEFETPAKIRQAVVSSFRVQDSPAYWVLQRDVPDLVRLLRRMLEPDPTMRISVEEALEKLEIFAASRSFDIAQLERAAAPNSEWLIGTQPLQLN